MQCLIPLFNCLSSMGLREKLIQCFTFYPPKNEDLPQITLEIPFFAKKDINNSKKFNES